MKGEDCPFDHQLSKYPCTNYASKGSCSRGEECMFSHTVNSRLHNNTFSSATFVL
uniref:C3H1-type domain-containing protein n=1 Tax=Rhizophora mucronata TaxID=61149 RepID=A0A2P2KM72_RHIMU